MQPKQKLPKWAIFGAIAVGIIIVIYAKRARGKGAGSSSQEEALSQQSFIPVTGENVPGAGAGIYGGGGEGNNTALLMEYIKGSEEARTETEKLNKEAQMEHEKNERDFFSGLIQNLGTGGGAPSSASGTGVVSVPPPETAPAPSPAPAPPPSAPGPPPASCSGEFPNHNPTAGAPGPHSCYKYSRERCSNPAYPYKHVYQDGRVVCSPV